MGVSKSESCCPLRKSHDRSLISLSETQREKGTCRLSSNPLRLSIESVRESWDTETTTGSGGPRGPERMKTPGVTGGTNDGRCRPPLVRQDERRDEDVPLLAVVVTALRREPPQ